MVDVASQTAPPVCGRQQGRRLQTAGESVELGLGDICSVHVLLKGRVSVCWHVCGRCATCLVASMTVFSSMRNM